MRGGAEVELAAAHGWGGVAGFAEGEALDEAKFFIGGEDDEFALAGDVHEASAFSADTDGRGVVRAFGAFAPELFIGGGTDAGDVAVFLPEKEEVAEGDGRGDVAADADDFVGFLGFPFGGAFDDLDLAGGLALAALGDDHALGGGDG